jgi:hypothetical protein
MSQKTLALFIQLNKTAVVLEYVDDSLKGATRCSSKSREMKKRG